MSCDCYIFTGGEVFADTLREITDGSLDGAFIIAADSGYKLAKRFGVKPDMLLGDLDSLDKATLDERELSEIEKIIVSPIKDDTDTQLAVDTAISRGAERIFIIGGLGGRLDHTLSSVFLLEYIAQKGIECVMTDGKNRVRVMHAGTEPVHLTVSRGYKYLSLVALTDVCRGVSISGVYYPLDNVELMRKYSFAVSNEITADASEITLASGTMLVIESRD